MQNQDGRIAREIIRKFLRNPEDVTFYNDKGKRGRRIKFLTMGQEDKIDENIVEITMLLLAEFGQRFSKAYYNSEGYFCVRLLHEAPQPVGAK